MFTFCCCSDVFSSWSFCNTVPLFQFLFYFASEDILSIPVVISISLEKVYVLLFHSTFAMLIHLVIQLGAFAATHIFRAFLKKIVVICFLTSSLAPRKFKSPRAISVSRVIVTRLTLYCVCDHENFHELRGCFVF